MGDPTATTVSAHLNHGWSGGGRVIARFVAMSSAEWLGQFNGFVDPLTIMITLPLSVVGAFGGLWITGMTLNIFSMIGLVLLAGVVTKIGILVVEFANQLRAEGLSVDEAVVKAATLRLRPILMTTISTVGAALPVAIGFGEGSEQRAPQAVVIIGGLMSSTLLTLIVLPCVYRVLSARPRRSDEFPAESAMAGGAAFTTDAPTS